MDGICERVCAATMLSASSIQYICRASFLLRYTMLIIGALFPPSVCKGATASVARICGFSALLCVVCVCVHVQDVNRNRNSYVFIRKWKQLKHNPIYGIMSPAKALHTYNPYKVYGAHRARCRCAAAANHPRSLNSLADSMHARTRKCNKICAIVCANAS